MKWLNGMIVLVLVMFVLALCLSGCGNQDYVVKTPVPPAPANTN